MDVQAVPCGQLIFLACGPWDQAPGHVRLPLHGKKDGGGGQTGQDGGGVGRGPS